ncbi:xanthine dehydrogenase accessory protein XdhC [Bosea sp. BK604]|uniref:xanthine dehydrogenase accessory protein XdhC n=1 Tax=Bosea sp. BK604 TaxID=2512180 RepID=UPI00104E70B2|nr:xanthine dehydrogenase accessory protein XdhC [Bosea sp. BK604]TCR64961.1 molybdenum cofactor sulfurylase [Bosea sp. BK604]
MIALSAILDAQLAEGAILVRIETAEGSTPREAGAVMIVTTERSTGTIGGGQLEFHCIDIARTMLAGGELSRRLDIPLGPQMGQCCGGRVSVTLERGSPAHVDMLATEEAARRARRPAILIFGAGHTGRVLARTLAPLPFAVTLIDDRDDQVGEMPAEIARLRLDDPEQAIATAPAGAAFIVLTHSHALDYRLTEAALLRGDAAYVGMIGSATKRARFASSFRRRHPASPALADLTCPIGGDDVDDKRPEVIAALTTAELVRCLLAHKRASERVRRRSGEKGWR